MKKGLAFLAIIIVLIAIGYTSMNGDSKTNHASQANQEVTLKNGEKMKLTAEESALKPAQGEQKVVITDLGMY
jgi:ABC-type enterochelin transport system substrate-binding protein